MADVVYGLTVLQPVASAMVDVGPGRTAGRPAKPVENRGWAPTAKLPLLVAVHAGARAWPGPGGTGWDEGAAWVGERWPAMPSRSLADFPLSAILGVVRVVDVCSVRGPVIPSMFGPAWRPDELPWVLGPRCWVIDRAWRLPAPLPCRGHMNLWRLPPDLAAVCSAAVDAEP